MARAAGSGWRSQLSCKPCPETGSSLSRAGMPARRRSVKPVSGVCTNERKPRPSARLCSTRSFYRPGVSGWRRTIREGRERMSDFHDLIEREIPRLRRYARALTRSTDRADDLVQETLLRAVAKAHLWQQGTDIRAWLFTIMHNQYVNMVRRAIREEATVDIEQLSSSLAATTDPTASRQ